MTGTDQFGCVLPAVGSSRMALMFGLKLLHEHTCMEAKSTPYPTPETPRDLSYLTAMALAFAVQPTSA